MVNMQIVTMNRFDLNLKIDRFMTSSHELELATERISDA